MIEGNKGLCRYLLIFAVFIFCIPLCGAQDFPDVHIMLSPRLADGLKVVYVSDMDILDNAMAEYFFDMEIYNVLQDWADTKILIKLRQDDFVISESESDLFVLLQPEPPPASGTPAYTASNVDLLNLNMIPGMAGTLSFNSHSYDMPDNAFERFFARSGRLERGTYYLEVILDNPAWPMQTVMDIIQIRITNPSIIILQHPQDNTVVNTTFPFFQYDSDAEDFILNIYRRLNDDDDVETVLAGVPVLQYNTTFKQIPYAITNGEALEPGAVYYWFVEAQVPTTAGIDQFRSEVRRFTVNTESVDEVINLQHLLEPLLRERTASIVSQLAGYELKDIKVDGQIITLLEWMEIVDAYLGTAFEVTEIEME
ncbi:hypothetical protein KAR48_03070 [bacterium]|nr:hypothetical protein [bacterium]